MVKKISDGTPRKKIGVRELIEQNKWNPFERVDPKILEALHRRSASKRVARPDYEEAPF
jgi:hypothetical protein